MSRLRLFLLVVTSVCLLMAWVGQAYAAGPEARWRLGADPDPGQLFLGLSFIDADHGWVCAMNGKVATTTDGGATWSTASTGGWTLQDVDFVSTTTGWTVSLEGGIHKSTDGGATWSRQYYASSSEFFGVEAVDATHAWVGGRYGALLSTDDGGATWVSHDLGTNYPVNGIAFSDLDHGWLTDGKDVRRTIDGGATWQTLPAGSTVENPFMVSSPSRDVVVVGDGHSVAFSRDEGATWTCTAVGDTFMSLNGICAVDADSAWAATLDGGIWVTGDGGITWSEQSSDPVKYGGYGELVIIGQRGFVSGSGVLTTDRTGLGGDVRSPVTTWTLDPSPLPRAESGALRAPTTVTFAASDESPGAVATFFRLDGGAWQPGLLALLDVPADHSNDGPHTLEVCSIDATGNDEVGNKRTLFADTQVPSVTASPQQEDMMGHWINHESVVQLTVHDPSPSSGAWPAQCVDGHWRYGAAEVTIGASGRHTNDGLHRVRVRAYDGAGNESGDTRYIVGVDTRRPTPGIPASCRVRRGSTARVAFRINDKQPCPGVGLVGIVILRSNGRLAAQYWPKKWYKANVTNSYPFRCKLAKGTYKLLVYAADGAGNVRKQPAVSSLTVL